MTGKFIKADALQYIPSLDNNSIDPFEDNERGFHDCQKPVARLLAKRRRWCTLLGGRKRRETRGSKRE